MRSNLNLLPLPLAFQMFRHCFGTSTDPEHTHSQSWVFACPTAVDRQTDSQQPTRPWRACERVRAVTTLPGLFSEKHHGKSGECGGRGGTLVFDTAMCPTARCPALVLRGESKRQPANICITKCRRHFLHYDRSLSTAPGISPNTHQYIHVGTAL